MTYKELVDAFCCLEHYVKEGRPVSFITAYIDRLICNLGDCDTTTTTTTTTTAAITTTTSTTTAPEGCILPTVNIITTCLTNIPGIGGVTNGLYRVYIQFISTGSDPNSVAYTITNSYNGEVKNVTLFSGQITALVTDFPNDTVFDMFIERDDTPDCILTIPNVTNQVPCPDLTGTTTTTTTTTLPVWNLRVKTRNYGGYGDNVAFEAFLLSKGNVGVSVTDSNWAGTDMYYVVTGITGFAPATFADEIGLKEVVDLTGWVQYAGEKCFRSCSALNVIEFPIATSIGDSCLFNCISLTDVNIPSCTNLGSTTGMNAVFTNDTSGFQLRVPVALATAQGGLPDGDIQYAISVGANIFYL